MELRHYWNILRRSWPLVVGLPLVVALLTIVLSFVLPSGYAVQTSMLVTLPCLSSTTGITLPNEDRQACWSAAEFVLDDALQLVESERFAADVGTWISTQHQQQIDPEVISAGIAAERKHRTLYLDVTAGSADHALWIAQGATAQLAEQGLRYWRPTPTNESLSISVVDAPVKAEPAKGLVGLALDIVLRSLLALLLAVGIAFLLHYLDQSLRRPDDVEALGFELVGAIPNEGRRRR